MSERDNMSRLSVETVIIGGGVVGLAVARQLASQRKSLIILERERQLGAHSSSRSSEVIHAGLYYPPGSEKARLCVRGRRLLYSYADSRHIPYQKLGKLIIAPNGREDQLEPLLTRGQANGVEGLTYCDRAQLKALEPALVGGAAIASQESGIINSHQLLRCLKIDAEQQGASIVLESPVQRLETQGVGYQLWVGGALPSTLSCREVINCAGLWAPTIAPTLDPEGAVASYAKGNYFSLRGSAPSQRLIYPLPEPGGLGIHLTLDLNGRARFGPDVEWLPGLSDSPDYRVSTGRIEQFESAIRCYWPALPPGSLSPDYSGIRVKRAPRGIESDFLISDHHVHGHVGLINLLGIESPGLTSALAIAEEVECRLAETR